MQGKYKNLVKQTWSNNTIYAESIPHLLHWDLAYLWMLQKVHVSANDAQIPPDWQERLKGWHRLASLFMMGQVDVETRALKDPLRQHTKPFGIEEVSWVTHGGKPVGVLSPLVLVRPLPDFKGGDEEDWPEHPMQKSPKELRHFAHLTVNYLRSKATQEGAYARQLAEVLQKAFEGEPMGSPPNGKAMNMRVMKDLRWTKPPTFEEIRVYVKDDKAKSVRPFLPRCTEPGCNKLLLQEVSAAPLEVKQDERVEVACPNGHKNTIELEDLLVWYRPGSTEAVVWTGSKTNLHGDPPKGQPPRPAVKGSHLMFEWNPSQVDGEEDRRFLGVDVRKPAREVNLDEVLYPDLLVPGDIREFDGLPLRYAWRDALREPASAQTAFAEDRRILSIKGLRLAGWPMPLDINYTQGSYREVPKLGVGLYPDPKDVPASWSRFRAFASLADAEEGSEQDDFRVLLGEEAQGRQLLPYVGEFSMPQGGVSFCVESTGRTEAGVMFHEGPPRKRVLAGTGEIKVGLDFGTTNTIVYALLPGQEISGVTPASNGLAPAGQAGLVKWMSRAEGGEDVETIANFLAGPRYGEPEDAAVRTDPYIIPTALWDLGDDGIIGWGQGDELAQYGEWMYRFKFDDDGFDHSQRRLSFLREVLFLSLPQALSKIASGATAIGKVRVGMAFPIGLPHHARSRMRETLSKLGEALQEDTGFIFEFYSLSESAACVQAYGQHDVGKTFLIADMGGGTLDIALLEMRGVHDYDIHQIGSVRFAGEDFIEAVSKRITFSNEAEVRDRIRRGVSHRHFGGDAALQGLLAKFMTLAYEFLRTLVAAHQAKQGGREVDLVLVGNGWHLVEAFSGDTEDRGPQRVFRERHALMTERLGMSGVSLRRSERLEGLPSSKHLVVIGALMNAASHTPRRELHGAGDPDLTQLPAGRTFRVGGEDGVDVLWDDMVGDGPAFKLTRDDLNRASVTFDLEEVPAASSQWVAEIRRSLGRKNGTLLPMPDEAYVRQELFQHVRDDGHIRFVKGPLQIIVDNGWRPWIKKDQEE